MAASGRDLVVLVDGADTSVGVLGKMKAHRRGTRGINRVVYDITSKPPGTIKWE